MIEPRQVVSSNYDAVQPACGPLSQTSIRPKRGRPATRTLDASSSTPRPVGRPRGSGPKQQAKAELLANGGSVSPMQKRRVGRPRKVPERSSAGRVIVRMVQEKFVSRLFTRLFTLFTDLHH